MTTDVLCRVPLAPAIGVDMANRVKHYSVTETLIVAEPPQQLVKPTVMLENVKDSGSHEQPAAGLPVPPDWPSHRVAIRKSVQADPTQYTSTWKVLPPHAVAVPLHSDSPAFHVRVTTTPTKQPHVPLVTVA